YRTVIRGAATRVRMTTRREARNKAPVVGRRTTGTGTAGATPGQSLAPPGAPARSAMPAHIGTGTSAGGAPPHQSRTRRGTSWLAPAPRRGQSVRPRDLARPTRVCPGVHHVCFGDPCDRLTHGFKPFPRVQAHEEGPYGVRTLPANRGFPRTRYQHRYQHDP